MGKPQKASKQGRPSKYTQELADTICERIAAGESLRAICAEVGESETTVRRWALNDVGGFSAQYARAREIQAETLVDQIVQIADASENDFTVTEDGKKIVNQEVVARARLRVDARKWVASKILPKVYGDKVDTNITGTMKFELSAPWLERIVQERGLV
jgi:hypothetical protein